MSMFDYRVRFSRRHRSRLAGTTIAVALALFLAVGCSVSAAPGSLAGVRSAPGTAPSAAPGTVLKVNGAPAGSAFASAVSTAVPPNPLGPPADPFAGTPADHWAEGAAGIVLPVARPVGGFTTAQVKYAYETTRKLLVAANLDKKTLLGGMPTAFANLLTSQQRATFLDGLNKLGVDKQGLPLSTRTWVMSFPPGEAQLIGSVIKVHGTMHAKAVRDKNGGYELDVDLDYLFVYPIEPPHQAASWMRVVDEESGSVDFGDWAGAATTFAPWVQFSGSAAGALCGARDGYQHPDYPNDVAARPTVSPTGTPVNPYALGKSISGVCQSTTGT